MKFDPNESIALLANKIALLEVNLANEIAQKKATIQYAESLEKEIEKLKGKSAPAVENSKNDNAK